MNGASNYMTGRAMALSFKPLSLQDVKDAYISGAYDMEQLIDSSMWWKIADDELPKINREVIVLTSDGTLAYAHRPQESFKGRTIASGIDEIITPTRYGRGQWNIPNVLFWLDIEIPDIKDYLERTKQSFQIL